MNQLFSTSSATLPVPALLAIAGERALLRFLEFFAASIRNQHTRRACGRAVAEFLTWSTDAGERGLAAVQPLHVATWIEMQTQELAAASVKQRLAAVRHLPVRSTCDLLNTLAAITERNAGFRSLGDTWADTTTAHGRLMLTVLGGLAESECELIRARTSEGRARAKARGVKLGRKPKLTPHQVQEALRRRAAGEPVREIGRSYNVSHSTISRLSR